MIGQREVGLGHAPTLAGSVKTNPKDGTRCSRGEATTLRPQMLPSETLSSSPSSSMNDMGKQLNPPCTSKMNSTAFLIPNGPTIVTASTPFKEDVLLVYVLGASWKNLMSATWLLYLFSHRSPSCKVIQRCRRSDPHVNE